MGREPLEEGGHLSPALQHQQLLDQCQARLRRPDAGLQRMQARCKGRPGLAGKRQRKDIEIELHEIFEERVRDKATQCSPGACLAPFRDPPVNVREEVGIVLLQRRSGAQRLCHSDQQLDARPLGIQQRKFLVRGIRQARHHAPSTESARVLAKGEVGMAVPASSAARVRMTALSPATPSSSARVTTASGSSIRWAAIAKLCGAWLSLSPDSRVHSTVTATLAPRGPEIARGMPSVPGATLALLDRLPAREKRTTGRKLVGGGAGSGKVAARGKAWTSGP